MLYILVMCTDADVAAEQLGPGWAAPDARYDWAQISALGLDIPAGATIVVLAHGNGTEIGNADPGTVDIDPTVFLHLIQANMQSGAPGAIYISTCGPGIAQFAAGVRIAAQQNRIWAGTQVLGHSDRVCGPVPSPTAISWTEIFPPRSPPGPRRLAIGAARTTLDAVISGIPWQGGYQTGAGMDAITGAQAAIAIADLKTGPATEKRSTETFRFVMDESSLEQEIDTSASGKYNFEGVTVSGSAAYIGKIKVSTLAITLVAEYTFEYTDYDRYISAELTADAQKYVDDPEKFRSIYGDYFIACGRRGSSFRALFTCVSRSEEDMTSFKASFGAEAPNVFSAEGSAAFMRAASSNRIAIDAFVFMEGYSGTPPGVQSPEDVVKALEWFKAHATGAELEAEMRHYSTIAPTLPRSVPIDPETFVEMRMIYEKLWQARSLYASCAPSYQKALRSAFELVDTEVPAKQDVMATDASERHDLGAKLDTLLQKLNVALDREAFYWKVVARRKLEPEMGEWISAEDRSEWLYGFDSYKASDAVTIEYETRHVSRKWHIGHRSHTFELLGSSRWLVVGWRVSANWRDGSDGEWTKLAETNILSDGVRVAVESKYDRGFDWSVTAYAVEAADYDFSS